MASIEIKVDNDLGNTPRKLCLLVFHAGAADLADCATPILHALTANALECETELYFIGRSVRLLSGEVAQSVNSGETPKPVSALLDDAHANGIRIYACTSAWKSHVPSGALLAPQCAGFAGALLLTLSFYNKPV